MRIPWVRVQFLSHFGPCTTDSYLQNGYAHVLCIAVNAAVLGFVFGRLLRDVLRRSRYSQGVNSTSGCASLGVCVCNEGLIAKELSPKYEP